MLKKLIRVLRNFYKTLNIKEILELFLPIILVIVFIMVFKVNVPTEKISEYVSDINDATLTIMSLLVAFGVAIVTLIFTSSSESVQAAKDQYLNDVKNINNIPINYYQLILIRIYYSLIMQIILICLAIIIKVFLFNITSIIVVFLEVVLLLHVIIVELKIIISMYHLMWKE